MNLKVELTKEHQNLLEEMSYSIEDKEYSKDEINMCIHYITDYIMSKSSKNGSIQESFIKCDGLINALEKSID